MKIKRSIGNLVITGILNESLLDDVAFIAQKSSCKCQWSDNCTKATISGNSEQINAFINLWNNQ